MRNGSWFGWIQQAQIIRDLPPGEPRGQLYDLATDPADANNLYDEHPEIVAELTALLAKSRESGRALRNTGNITSAIVAFRSELVKKWDWIRATVLVSLEF